MKLSGFLSKESVNPVQNLRDPENTNAQFTSKVVLNAGNADNDIRRNWFPVLSGNCFCWQAAWEVVSDLQITETLLFVAALFSRLEYWCILFCHTSRNVLLSWISFLLNPNVRCSKYALAWGKGITSSEMAKKPFCRSKGRYLLKLALFVFKDF